MHLRLKIDGRFEITDHAHFEHQCLHFRSSRDEFQRMELLVNLHDFWISKRSGNEVGADPALEIACFSHVEKIFGPAAHQIHSRGIWDLLEELPAEGKAAEIDFFLRGIQPVLQSRPVMAELCGY